jgi:cystathionine beta-synthase
LVLLPDNGRAYLSKAFNDAWMRENGFLPSPLKSRTVWDLLEWRKSSAELVTADVGDKVVDVVTKMQKVGISQVPVFSNGQLVGILDESDLLEPLVRGSLKPTEPIIHLVKGTIEYIQPNEDLAKLNELLTKGFVALVKDGTKLRIITKIDLLQYMGEMADLQT